MNPDLDKNEKDDEKILPDGQDGSGPAESKPLKQMKCEDIQPMILDYLNRELSDAFSLLVREHIRKCPNCKAVATEMKATVDALKKADTASPDLAAKLSVERRNKIMDEVVGGHQYQWVYLAFFIVAVFIVVWSALRMLAEIYDWGYKPIKLPEDQMFEINLRPVNKGTNAPGISTVTNLPGTNIMEQTKP
ncbi:MAG: hypothetical protein C0404_07905 [Verrucomicrobia bacterium]|nr:hypothetical protein [Verrucomicrobiota bacterium]